MFILMGTTLAVGYFNANVLFLLRNPDYFNVQSIPASEGQKHVSKSQHVGQINSTIVMYSLIVSAILSVFMG